jgi:hypothetical protein
VEFDKTRFQKQLLSKLMVEKHTIITVKCSEKQIQIPGKSKSNLSLSTCTSGRGELLKARIHGALAC